MSEMITKENQSNGFVISWRILKFTLKTIFPSYALLQINRNLARASSFYKNPWFQKQITRNYIVAVVLSLLFLAPMSVGILAVKQNKNFNQKIESAKRAVFSREIKKAGAEMSAAFSDKKFILVVKVFGSIALFGLLAGNFIVFSCHDLIRDSKKLIKILKHEGVIDKENNSPLALYTPIGILVDLSGSSPKEVAHNERIWMAMNIQIKDWSEDPDKRSLVFFKTSFKLKSRYDFIF